MKRCISCGKIEKSNNAQKCSSCGNRLEEYSGAADGGERSTIVYKKNTGMIAVIILLLVIIAAGSVVGVIAIKNSKNADDVTEEVIENTDEEDEAEPEKQKAEEKSQEKAENKPEEKEKSKKFKVPVFQESDEKKAESDSNTNCMIINCEKSVTLRKTASVKGEELAQIPLNAQVEYEKFYKNGFCKIKYNGQSGYVLISYLSVPEYIEADYSAEVVKCQKDITLRITPSTSGKQLDFVPLGTVVDVISVAENGFYCVRYNGRYGFALASYLLGV